MSSGTRIIPIHEHHIDDVVAIEEVTSATPWSASTFITEMNSPTHILLVAVIDSDLHPHTEKVVGFSGGQMIGNELHIHSLAVGEAFRRTGTGTNLIRNLIQVGSERDAISATLEVRIGNVGAIKLYETLGFATEGIRPKYYVDNGEDAAIMWLRSFEGLQ